MTTAAPERAPEHTDPRGTAADSGNPPWLASALITEGAVFLALAIGALIGRELPLPAVIALLLAPIVLLATVISAEVGLLILFLVVFSNASVVLVGHGLPSTLQPLLGLLVLTVALRAAWQRRLPSGLLLPGLLLGGYGLVLTLSLFFAVDFDKAFLGVSTYAKDALLTLLVLTLLRTARSLERVLWALVTVGFLLAAAGVFQYLTGSFGQEFGGFAQASVQNIAGGDDDHRISGPLEDPNHYAQVLVVLAALALGRMRAVGPPLARAFAGSALLLILLAIVFTFSRGALVALVVLLVVAAVRRPPPAAVMIAGLVAVLVTMPFLPSGYTERLASAAEALPGVGSGRTGETSLSGRFSALQAGRAMAVDNPLQGVGLGQFTEHFRAYSLGKGLHTPNGDLQSHNLFLQIAAETGLLGLLGFSALLVLAGWRLRRGRIDLLASGHRRHALMLEDLQLALLGYLAAGMFVHMDYSRYFFALLGVCFAAPFVVRDLTTRSAATEDRPADP